MWRKHARQKQRTLPCKGVQGGWAIKTEDYTEKNTDSASVFLIFSTRIETATVEGLPLSTLWQINGRKHEKGVNKVCV